MNYEECDCEDWKISMPQIQTAQMLVWQHSINYTGKPFIYCPWCGKIRKEISTNE